MKGKLFRFCTLITAIVLVLSLALPSFAFEVDPYYNEDIPRSMGYRSGSITLNNTSYNYSAYFSSSSSAGVRSVFTSSAYVRRAHQNLTVVFNTTIYGQSSSTGGYNNVKLSGTSYSGYVSCTYGMSYVTSYASISGKIYVYGDSTYDISLSA